MKKPILLIIFSLLTSFLFAQYVSKVWISDIGNGRYKNPVIYADYSDLDVCRVTDKYYMVSSSFNCVPGLPILESKDLVNWKIIGHGLDKISPIEKYSNPTYAKGASSPSIRYYNEEFFIYYADPDTGIYMIKSKDPEKRWEKPILILEGKGLSDPCPIWVDDHCYLLYSYANNTTTGINSLFILCELSTDGKKYLGNDLVIFDANQYGIIEGAKITKYKNSFFIFSSAGTHPGNGSVLCLRSTNIYGPYEEKIVLNQAKTTVDGPYKGAFLSTPKEDEHWYIFSQHLKNFGKTVHLNPIQWENNWPIIGGSYNKNNAGEPIMNYKKPNIAETNIESPIEDDDFSGEKLGLQWQWLGNPQPYWYYLNKTNKTLRLYACQTNSNAKNLLQIPNLLLQKIPSESFTLTTKLVFTPGSDNNGERCGIIVAGSDYAILNIERNSTGIVLSQRDCINAPKGTSEIENKKINVNQQEIYLRVKMKKDFKCTFSYSLDGKIYFVLGKDFNLKEGENLGAKIGLFCTSTKNSSKKGWVDVTHFTFER
jgi:beta-xylosidase